MARSAGDASRCSAMPFDGARSRRGRRAHNPQDWSTLVLMNDRPPPSRSMGVAKRRRAWTDSGAAYRRKRSRMSPSKSAGSRVSARSCGIAGATLLGLESEAQCAVRQRAAHRSFDHRGLMANDDDDQVGARAAMARSARASIGSPPISCRTLALPERIRVPSPAARTIAASGRGALMMISCEKGVELRAGVGWRGWPRLTPGL